MANVLKDNGAGTPLPLFPTGEQQIAVSIRKFSIN
jgi:hypothetical protein